MNTPPTLTIVSSSAVPQKPSWEGEELLKYGKDKELARSPHNVRILLQFYPDYKEKFRWNNVTLKVESHGDIFPQIKNKDVSIDHLVSLLQDHFSAKHNLDISRTDIGYRVIEIAQENSYDPIQNWLSSLTWDGIHRLDDWLITYAGADQTKDKYTSFAGKKWFLSIVARAFQPGCKADDVLVAEGLQGAHKSTLFSILGGEWFAEGAGALGDKDSKMLIATALLVELPDMAAFSKSDRNAMKAFFSLQRDKFRPPYGKEIVTIKRRAVFAATTNDEEYFTDPTGNRRYRPVQLKQINRAKLIEDRDKLFAEAVFLWKAAENCEQCKHLPIVVPGEKPRCPQHAWWYTEEEERIAAQHARIREECDSWTHDIFKFIRESKTDEKLTTANILTQALRFQLKDVTRREEMRVAMIMKKEGYVRHRRGADSPWTLVAPPPPLLDHNE